jgi:mannitol/fructose-specific phosphotransferase system IIA component (Ntr-type)
MGAICTRLPAECIFIQGKSPGGKLPLDKEQVVRLLAERLARTGAVEDTEMLIRDVLEREQLASTCLGFGCAVPHAHSQAVSSTVLAAASLDPPLTLETPDGQPVSLLFLMAGPVQSAALHLRLLSKLARLLHDPIFRDELREASDAKEFHERICLKEG